MRMITNGHADVTSTIAIIDFETTGLDPHRGDRPTEVAVVFVRNQQIVDRYQRLINPGRSIPSFVTSLTGITNAMVRDAPPVEKAMEELHQRIGNTPLIAHNASFDKKFLDTELERIGKDRRQDFICSMRVARRVLWNASNFKLGTLVKHVGLTFSSDAHRALADAEMTAKLWVAMEQTLQRKFGLQNVPLGLLDRLQSVTIAKADEYLRGYARTQRQPQDNPSTSRRPKISQKPTTGKRAQTRKTTKRASPPADRVDSPVTVKCITCDYAISVAEIDGIRWLKCPCCGFNTPHRHNG